MLVLSKEGFRSTGDGQHYVDMLQPDFIKAIGVAKLLAAGGLILPPVLDVLPGLVPFAALGLVLLMTGATTVRIVREEWRYAVGDLMFFTLAAFVAWGRFGPQSFGS